MISRWPRPTPLQGILAMLAIVFAWGFLRLWIFREQQLPLTYVVPLLVVVWTRQRWQLVILAVIFALMSSAKFFWILPEAVREERYAVVNYITTLTNIGLGAVVILLILRLRDRLDERAAAIQQQNAELEAQAEELAQQNEEIKTQGEELAQQNEEIESQAEELQRQNEELTESNRRLVAREAVLQAAVEGARQAAGGAAVLEVVCTRVLPAMGVPAELIAVAEADDGHVIVRAQAAAGEAPRLPERWPRAGSLAGLVLAQNRSAYIDDLHCRPDLAVPFNATGYYRSVLASPLAIGGRPGGLVLVGSRTAGHWTQDQFHLLEWTAAQCGWIIEALHWQSALRNRADMYEAAGRAKDEFLATLSHELRTPLSPVLAAVEELVEDRQLPMEVRDQLEMIRRNVAVQSRLIDDLLDLTRIARGKMDLDQRPVAVGRLLRETAAIVAGDVAANQQALTLQIDLPPECYVQGDAARLQQVFWNLLKNGTKFSPPGATIVLRATLVEAVENGDPPRVAIAVTDPGIGIAREDLERVFLPFEQVTSTRRRGTAGLGLGLSIARAITELHDGRISVTSAGPGTGATFTVELPLLPGLAVDGAVVADPGALAARGDAVRPVRVLLAEDHADTGAAIQRLLRGAGYQVEHAASVAEAWSRWQAGRFDLLISDLGLPDGTGMDLVRRIAREAGAPIRAICMSGYGMESDLADSRDAGFQAHLIKPVSKQQLLGAVQRVLAGATDAEADVGDRRSHSS